MNVSGVQAAILRARALVRCGQISSAVDSLDLDLSDTPHELAAEALAVKSFALQVLRRSEEASSLAIEARARCFSSGLANLEGELLFASAIAGFISHDYAAVKASAEAILSLVDDRPAWVVSNSYGYSLSYWRAKACDILAAMESLRSNYTAQVSWISRAFQEFDASGVSDEYTLASFVANYADAATKVGHDEIAEYAVHRANRVRWTPSLASFEFRVFSSLAESASAAGDQLSAMRHFRRCLDCAPSVPLQVRASLERARLLREIGESLSSREELEYALKISRTVNWEETSPLNQRQLLMLAGQVAHFDSKQAERLIARYDGLTKNSVDGFAVRDNAFRGEELVARAAVARGMHAFDRAALFLVDALEILKEAKLFAKAALVAAELADITGEPHYIEFAREQSIRQPQSILARKVEVLEHSVARTSETSGTVSNVVSFRRPNSTLIS